MQAKPRLQQWGPEGKVHGTVTGSTQSICERSPQLHPSMELGQLQEKQLEWTPGAATLHP